MEIESSVLSWLLEGDVSLQCQVHRDLLGEERPDLQARIAQEGWGAAFLSKRRPDGHWGRGFYQPKWISTHYSVLDLRNLGLPQDHPQLRETVAIIARGHKAEDGGINPAKTRPDSDVCITGMFMNYACYFGLPEEDLRSVVDFVIQEHMADGGYNCKSNQGGAVHSSLHTTLSILEGILEYERSGCTHRLDELLRQAEAAREFILMHRLFRSDRTGEVIDRKFLMLSYPSRWKYDVLRALDYFQDAGLPFDPRMQDALDVVLKKRRSDGCWPVQAKHPGKTHFDMEKTGQPSRWNTLRALRVLGAYGG